MWFPPDVPFLLSIVAGDTDMITAARCFIMTLTYQAELWATRTTWTGSACLHTALRLLLSGASAVMQPRDYVFC